MPVLVGSGVTTENVAQYMSANALIVGSHLKMFGQWSNDIDPMQVKLFMGKVQKIRETDSQEQLDDTPKDGPFPTVHSQGE